jgi:hypothetical protein
MALTVAEALKELSRLRNEREIWMDIVEYLSRCIDRESPSGKANAYITVREGGNRVPQDMVVGFVENINEERIDPLNQMIEELESLNVYEETEDDGPEGKKKKTPSKKANKQAAKPKAGSTRKRIRAIPKPAGPKAQSTG